MVAMVHLAVEPAKVCLNHRTCAGSLGRLESSATIWTSPIRVAYHYLGTPNRAPTSGDVALFVFGVVDVVRAGLGAGDPSGHVGGGCRGWVGWRRAWAWGWVGWRRGRARRRTRRG